MSQDEKILEELQVIKNILVFSNSEKIDNILLKIINTENRKKCGNQLMEKICQKILLTTAE